MRDVRMSVFQLFFLVIGMIIGTYGFHFFKEVPDWETAFIASFFQVWAYELTEKLRLIFTPSSLIFEKPLNLYRFE